MTGPEFSDQWWAVVIGASTMITLRVLDFFMPKGWVSKWTRKHADKISDGSDDDGERDDQPVG